MRDGDEILPVGPAARRLRVPSRWLRAEIEAGRLPGLKAGTRLLVHPPTVAKLLAQRARSGDVARLVTATEAAQACGISRSTWWARHADGSIPLPVRIGRCTRWRRQELLDWILAGCPARRQWRWQPKRTYRRSPQRPRPRPRCGRAS